MSYPGVMLGTQPAKHSPKLRAVFDVFGIGSFPGGFSANRCSKNSGTPFAKGPQTIGKLCNQNCSNELDLLLIYLQICLVDSWLVLCLAILDLTGRNPTVAMHHYLIACAISVDG